VEQPVSSNGPAAVAHRILDRLTAMKLRVGSVRLHLRLGAIAPAEIENHLERIEQEIDATAALAQDMQAEGSSSR
jgi:L-lysine 2,3-aminomutase